MMYACLIIDCSRSFERASLYLKHLKTDHRVPVHYRYKCTYKDCKQIFSVFYPFKKHIMRHSASQTETGSINVEETSCYETQPTSSGYNSTECQQPKKLKTYSDVNIDAKDCTLSTNLKSLESAAVNFTLQMHAKHNVTRKDVYNIQKNVNELLSNIAILLESLDMYASDAETEFAFKKYLSIMKNLFSNINSDYKLFKYLKKTEGHILPTILTFENEAVEKMSLENNLDYSDKPNELVIMPIMYQIQAFFAFNDCMVLKMTLENTNQLIKSKRNENFVNGSVWKNVLNEYGDHIVLPIFVYGDEFEINDPQSSHSGRHNVCGIYYSFPTIPEHFLSRLNHIFVAGMLKKTDIKDVGINRLLSELIGVFREIELKGIEFNLDGRTVNVKFVLSLVQGDNLGIHQMLMLASGFNANFYCRFCRRPKQLMQTDTSEHSEYFRNVRDYEENLKLNKLSDTGIAGNSVFNGLPNFHVIVNKSVDAMHDLFSSGICKHGLTEILDHCIYIKKYITLQQFNERRKNLSRMTLDEDLKRMPDVGESYIRKEKRKTVVFRMTSSEMRCFLHFFPLIIGDQVPRDEIVWKYCITLVKLVDVALKRSFTPDDVFRLQMLIRSHHEMYQELFKKNLKPKHHMVVHYPSVIKASGPIRYLMCFRNEAKHKGFKQYAHMISSRKNICFTLCVKASLQFTFDLASNSFFENELNCHLQLCNLRLRYYFTQIIQPIRLNLSFENYNLSTNLIYKGTTYKNGHFMTYFYRGNMFLFEILEIVVHENNPHLICQHWNVGGYDDHFLAYEALNRIPIVDIFNIEFFDGPPVSLIFISKKNMFRVKNSFNNCY
ncbi:uncharacterized protein LOC129738704 [Uranotaenia lowii]|uniref:uncharacterized protein LOC129738704 n=1 Tax=Uranotaenia lowii TaxID=190385 RepID=UPI00247A1A5F|nr:uncharacterized protein LOC129738704 [Uranotaenia lowii]XP_055585934.1 uncharacterized protein LOC129738704 [Uranotaenia lowii]